MALNGGPQDGFPQGLLPDYERLATETDPRCWRTYSMDDVRDALAS
jgi:hypothetical protein